MKKKSFCVSLNKIKAKRQTKHKENLQSRLIHYSEVNVIIFIYKATTKKFKKLKPGVLFIFQGPVRSVKPKRITIPQAYSHPSSLQSSLKRAVIPQAYYHPSSVQSSLSSLASPCPCSWVPWALPAPRRRSRRRRSRRPPRSTPGTGRRRGAPPRRCGSTRSARGGAGSVFGLGGGGELR